MLVVGKEGGGRDLRGPRWFLGILIWRGESRGNNDGEGEGSEDEDEDGRKERKRGEG
jgi:hypothetical protein